MSIYHEYDDDENIIDDKSQLAIILYITVIECDYHDDIDEEDERLKIIDGSFDLVDGEVIVYVKKVVFKKLGSNLKGNIGICILKMVQTHMEFVTKEKSA